MPAVSASPPPFPESVGKYELLLPIGTGGMATVYLARTTGVGGFERRVALKLVHAHLRADEESKLHLLEEAKLAALIRHPNVIQVQEIDEDPFGVFLVMDYVEGDTLAGVARMARDRGAPLPRPMIARILNDALLGLHAAHDLRDRNGKTLGLVHRDFSPQNILVSVEGHTRLGDFGVAKAADRAVRTKTGLTKGKIAYMSPEQARGRPVDRRCDVWAAGVVAWELIASRRMFDSDDDVATLLSIVTEHPRRLSEVLDDVPQALDDAIAWALQPELDKRCPDAESLRKSLEVAWQGSCGMAEISELSAFVRELTRDELARRQSRIDALQGKRARLGQVTETQAANSQEASLTAREPTPVSEPRSKRATRVDTPVPSRPELENPASRERWNLESAPTSPAHERFDEARLAPATLPRLDDDPADSAPTRILETPSSALPRRDELTETSAVVPTWVQPNQRHRVAVASFIAFGALVLGTVWYLNTGGSSSEGVPTTQSAQEQKSQQQSSQGQSQEQADPPRAGAAARQPSRSQADSESGVTPVRKLEVREVESLPLDSAPTQPVKRSNPQKVKRSSSSRQTSPAPAQNPTPVKKPRLAPSPYGTSKSEE